MLQHDDQPPSKPNHAIQWIAMGGCALLLLVFFALSRSASNTKSPTWDEGLHAVGAWVHLHQGDYRINYEDPPLWHFWAALPNKADALKMDPNDPLWVTMPQEWNNQWHFSDKVLYSTYGNDGPEFVRRSQRMMTLIGVALGIVIVVFAWQLGGPIAALTAAALFSLDPNFLGHSALIKNDVPLSMMMLAIFLTTWRVGKRATLINVPLLALLTAAALSVKFSAVLIGPMLFVLMVIRALLPIPWTVLGKTAAGLPFRLGVSAAILALVGFTSYVGIWMVFGFRFDPSPDANVQLNTQYLRNEALKYRFLADNPARPTRPFDPAISLDRRLDEFNSELESFRKSYQTAMDAVERTTYNAAAKAELMQAMNGFTETLSQLETARERVTPIVQNPLPLDQRAADYDQQIAGVARGVDSGIAFMRANDANLRFIAYQAKLGGGAPDAFVSLCETIINLKLLPSPWIHGVLFVHARSIIRGSFLLGQVSNTGWWYYFPLAFLFKTPLATLLTLIGAAGVLVNFVHEKWKHRLDFTWRAACFAVPVGVYMFSAMTSNLNIGIRHILPVYPFLFVAAGVMVAMAIRKWGSAAQLGAIALTLILALESIAAYPDYVAYFSFVFGGERGGFNLLADSNLDWGQDLPALAEWQKENNPGPIALSYFGRALPSAYGVDAVLADPFHPDTPPLTELAKTYIVAISATNLQGVYPSGPKYDDTVFQQYQPIRVLGGTIYLYDLRTGK